MVLSRWVQAEMQRVSLARFQSLACEKHQEVQDTHANMVAIMQRVQQEYKMATKLKKELQCERVVLQERVEVMQTKLPSEALFCEIWQRQR